MRDDAPLLPSVTRPNKNPPHRPAGHAKNTGYPSTGSFRFFVCPRHFAASRPSLRPSSVGYFVAFLREEGGTRMRDGRSLRRFELFAFKNLTRFLQAFSLCRAGSLTRYAGAPTRREPFHKNTLRFSFVCILLIGNTFFSATPLWRVFCYKKRTKAPRPSSVFVLRQTWRSQICLCTLLYSS